MSTSAEQQPGRYRHFIIGGTIKAATTSLFNYISAHPEVCGSKVKETFFFSRDYIGDPAADAAKYAAYFSPQPGASVLFEASPNYLAYKENVAPRIAALLPDVKLLFVLRNPVARLYSHFNFAKGKLELPQALSFEDFIELCERFDRGEITPAQAGVAEKHLRALEIGHYGRHLEKFYSTFDATRIKVIFFDELKDSPAKVLADISEFIGVDADFYRDFSMGRANVTFSARLKYLHYAALLVNRLSESLLRHRPALK
ncbi:MAG TPA: hypothetical protein ENJ64_02910, partial [Thiotrichales bacterium]|nr:hypothetical protein [Thiotrichales bacterium]